MRIGAHESASGGLYKAVARATADGCEALQVFVKNNNRWAQRAWTPEEVERFRFVYEESALKGLCAHAAYLINLCSTKPKTLQQSIKALADELSRCAQLRIPYLVMHPGSHLGEGEVQGIEKIVESLKHVYALEEHGDAWSGVTLLFENTAGQGTNIGYKNEHLRDLLASVHAPKRFGVCFDTCHAYAAGYDMTSESKYEEFWSSFDEVVGLEHLRIFHLNDSKKPLGSRRDRHEHIGQGYIGKEAFRLLVNDPRFATIPGVVETPPLEDGVPGFAHNISVLKGMRGKR